MPAGVGLEQLSERDRASAAAYLDKRKQPVGLESSSKWKLLGNHLKHLKKTGIRDSDTEQRVIDLRTVEKQISKSADPMMKMRYVFKASEQLEAHLKALEKDFKRLKRLVKSAWRDQHPNENDFEAMTGDERQLIALRGKHERALREAERDRPGTKALYDRCYTPNESLKLELNLLDPTGEASRKHFPIFVPWFEHNANWEILVKITQEDPSRDSQKFGRNLRDACEKAKNIGTCVLWVSDHFWVSLSSPLPTGPHEMKNLDDELERLAIAERLELAFKIAESGLVLLGTSWLSSLSTESVKRFKVQGKVPRYMVDISDNRELIGVMLEEAKPHDERVHHYIFSIGALLVEIALRNHIRDGRVREVKWSGAGLLLVTQESGLLKTSSISRLVDQVRKEMGVHYAEVRLFRAPIRAAKRWLTFSFFRLWTSAYKIRRLRSTVTGSRTFSVTPAAPKKKKL